MADEAQPTISGDGSTVNSVVTCPSSPTVEGPDVSLPITNVTRIMKKALPRNAKISREAKEAVHDCASEFISFITAEAMEKCQKEKRMKITGDDLLYGFESLGFEKYVDPVLKEYLTRYRESYNMKGSPKAESSTVRKDADSTPSVELTLGNPAYGGTKTE